jgi:hypothetical protein
LMVLESLLQCGSELSDLGWDRGHRPGYSPSELGSPE